MSRVYDADNDPDEADGQGNLPPGDERPTKGDRHEDVCDKWITTGRCRQKDCPGAHPDWDKAWDGQWLTAQCPELAAMAGVPPHWAP